MIGCLVFYGGVGQFIAGIMEFITGNTVTLHWIEEQEQLLTLVLFTSSEQLCLHHMGPSTCRTQ